MSAAALVLCVLGSEQGRIASDTIGGCALRHSGSVRRRHDRGGVHDTT